MDYRPVTAVWEITMGCNMRCKHCGSSCENSLPDELDTEEAVKLCEDLGKLGFQWITLSGGEPTTRKDWDVIAKALKDNGVIPNVITNGWLLSEEIIERAEKAGVNTMAISLDGLKPTHDYIRKEGSYDRIMKAFELFRGSKVNLSAITTLNNVNIKELPELKEILIEKGVKGWQLQIAFPWEIWHKNANLIARTQPYG
jgi:MoaA/NifB/PqqE/SkfB family radical SAM enzyme